MPFKARRLGKISYKCKRQRTRKLHRFVFLQVNSNAKPFQTQSTFKRKALDWYVCMIDMYAYIYMYVYMYTYIYTCIHTYPSLKNCGHETNFITLPWESNAQVPLTWPRSTHECARLPLPDPSCRRANAFMVTSTNIQLVRLVGLCSQWMHQQRITSK